MGIRLPGIPLLLAWGGLGARKEEDDRKEGSLVVKGL